MTGTKELKVQQIVDASSPQGLAGDVWLLRGPSGGKYPDANGLLVRGTKRTALIDAPLSLFETPAWEQPSHSLPPSLSSHLPRPDLVILSHCHEDHIPGLADPFLASLPCWVHRDDAPALASIDGFLDLFGMPEPGRSFWRQKLVDTFHFVPRPDAHTFRGGDVWDLGGVQISAEHTPGHTAGHCSLRVSDPGSLGGAPGSSDDVLFLGDIDLSGWGPYYGDAASSLEDVTQTLELARSWRALHFVTGHHIGVVDQETFDSRLELYIERIAARERRLLEFLSEPRTLDQMVEHRILYRPGDQVDGADWIERRSIGQHLDRLETSGAVRWVGERWTAQ